MSAPHFFAGSPAEGHIVVLTGDDARHAAGSRRLRPGDEITSSDGAGAIARCVVRSSSPERVEAKVLERSEIARPSPLVAVRLAAPKGDRLSWAVQKLTEIGADVIGILETDRSVRRWDEERARKQAGRLEVIAREAAKQSGRRFLPDIEGPGTWDEALERSSGTKVVLWEEATDPLLATLPADPEGRVEIFVGPEGGIAESDARGAQAGGAILASLGSTILRTETAAIVGASLALARYGRLGG
ncbi:MAG TPA: RsmE family RNA methyltransferase [Actinomycetota bacterium]|nr:RsmE family RNA methyltransferase [Actinomycetota bacterium]